MSTITDISLGYGGFASIDGQSVLVTSGSLEKSITPVLIDPLSCPIDGNRFPLIIGSGINAWTGSVAFDLTLDSVSKIVSSNFIKRNSVFDVVLCDGNKSYSAPSAKWSSITISASPNALVTCSVSFSYTNSKSDNFITHSSSKISVDFDDPLLSYWFTGEEEVESFTLTFNKNLTPVYANGSPNNPLYLREGLINATMQVSAWDTWLSHQSLKIADKTVSFSEAVQENTTFSYGGLNSTGTHSYTLKCVAVQGSSQEVLTIN